MKLFIDLCIYQSTALRPSKCLFVILRLGKNLCKYSYVIRFSVRLYVICKLFRMIFLQAIFFSHKDTHKTEEKIKKKNISHNHVPNVGGRPFCSYSEKDSGSYPGSSTMKFDPIDHKWWHDLRLSTYNHWLVGCIHIN